MLRVVFLLFAAPLLVSLRVDYSSTMVPQVLRAPWASACFSLIRPKGSAHEANNHKAQCARRVI